MAMMTRMVQKGLPGKRPHMQAEVGAFPGSLEGWPEPGLRGWISEERGLRGAGTAAVRVSVRMDFLQVMEPQRGTCSLVVQSAATLQRVLR